MLAWSRRSRENRPRADEVVVVGPSLPTAEVAVRALLNPLRFRLGKEQVQVRVVDPSKATLERWREFLGDPVRLERREADVCAAWWVVRSDNLDSLLSVAGRGHAASGNERAAEGYGEGKQCLIRGETALQTAPDQQ